MVAQKTSSTPLSYAISTISGKWKASILWSLSSAKESIRYAELKRMIPLNVSHKVFSQQLKEMVEDDIVKRTVIDTEEKNILHVEYSLTQKGYSLCNIIYLLRDWGSVYGNFDMKKELSLSRGSFAHNKVVYSSQDPSYASSLTDALTWLIINPNSKKESDLYSTDLPLEKAL